MELTAAVLAAKTSKMISKELDIKIDKTYFWTDSQVVLGYIKNEARNFKIFVANRVQQIQDLTNVNSWHYVSTKENPADHASRGIHLNQVNKVAEWFHGPKFIWEVPLQTKMMSGQEFQVEHDDIELKKEITVNVIVPDCSLLSTVSSRTNSWTRLIRIMMAVIKFVYLLKAKVAESKQCGESSDVIEVKSEVKEAEAASNLIIKMLQKEVYASEINQLLGEKQSIPKSSSISKLNPFLNDGILRVGGRLQNSDLPFSEKHPIILPKSHHVTIKIIEWCHQLVGHGGRNNTLNRIRQKGFWIVNGNSLTRNVISKCIKCRKLFGPVGQQKMGNLPSDRTESNPPFTNCGVDMFGPFTIKERRSVLKRYACLFTCLNSRAVHIEITTAMSTDSFILALRRFIGRRGNVRLMRSDNGTNFVGADNELSKSLKEMDNTRIKNFLLNHNADWIVWQKNPPLASHMGGVWERQIRSARRILTALLDEHKELLNEESLRTVMVETEAIINSRPLTVETINDSDSSLPLSPSNLLTMKSDVILPPPGIFESPDKYSRKQWRRVQHVANEFWHRWRKEFLSSLQERQKWLKTTRNLQIGDIVILKEDSERNKWPLARVVEVEADGDGKVRSARLKVANLNNSYKHEFLRRPISKLVLLVENVENENPSGEKDSQEM